jgi:cell division protein FtsA
MPDKLQSLSEKTIHIRSNSADPDKQLPVKYLSEIITARVEEIMMAILYEIDRSGFADMLRSGIVVTGGCAGMANLGNFIYDLSGYRCRTGYPRPMFSFQGCEGVADTSATTSIGLIMAAKEDQGVNCVVAGERAATVETAVTESEDFGGELFTPDQVETVTPAPKPAPKPRKAKDKESGIKVTWTKVNEFFGGLYASVNEDIEDIDKENV